METVGNLRVFKSCVEGNPSLYILGIISKLIVEYVSKGGYMAYLMQRKLIKLGGSTLVITLPKLWVDHMKLKAGDKVLVKVNSKLVISPITNEKDSGAISLQAQAPESTNQSINGGDPTHGN